MRVQYCLNDDSRTSLWLSWVWNIKITFPNAWLLLFFFNDGPEKLYPLCPVLNHRLCGGCQQPRLWGRAHGVWKNEWWRRSDRIKGVCGSVPPCLRLKALSVTVLLWFDSSYLLPCKVMYACIVSTLSGWSCTYSRMSSFPFWAFPFLSVPTNANTEIEISVDWQIIACIWTSFMCVAYPKLCFSCIGWKMHFEISWLIWVVLKWKHSLYLAHPFCSSPLFVHIQLFTMLCMWFSSFSKCQLSYLRRTLGVTCGRWLSMCKLTFRFLN